MRSEKISADLLRRYIENELSEKERMDVQSRLENSKAWMMEYERTQKYLSLLHALPSHSAPDRIWSHIAREVRSIPPKRPEWIWLYANLRHVKNFAYGMAVVLLLILGLRFPFSEPAYQVVTIQDMNRYRAEAESFVANHELACESLLPRESLIAYYTYK
ncbi:MAG: hypothetical protein C4527_05775 [Candidatus Omnitrophota bacterium]|nr:MAG: hypothetical protein C4527_05775 [Candidatus Omnitrophota bacterium]